MVKVRTISVQAHLEVVQDVYRKRGKKVEILAEKFSKTY